MVCWISPDFSVRADSVHLHSGSVYAISRAIRFLLLELNRSPWLMLHSADSRRSATFFFIIKGFVLPFNSRNLFDSTFLKHKPAVDTIRNYSRFGCFIAICIVKDPWFLKEANEQIGIIRLRVHFHWCLPFMLLRPFSYTNNINITYWNIMFFMKSKT